MTNTLQHQNQLLQDRFGLKMAARLNESAAGLPYEVSERLRAARVQALARRKVEASVTAPAILSSGGSAVLGFGSEEGGVPWYQRIAAVLPLILLVAGLFAISTVQGEKRAREVAEVDTALLTDDLPPSAYADPGFAQYLKQGGE